MNKIFTILGLFAMIAISQTAQAQLALVRSNFTGVIVPRYMTNASGNNDNNPGKLPFIYRATVSGLIPNYTYKYTTGAGLASDLGTTNQGAGGTVYINPGTGVITFNASPNWSASQSFTTDANGSYTGWFGFTADGDTRFTGANTLWPIITLGHPTNNGQYL